MNEKCYATAGDEYFRQIYSPNNYHRPDRVPFIMRLSKTIILVVLLAVFIVWYVMYSANVSDTGKMTRSQEFRIKPTTFTPLRVVHIDLKGAPPKMSYLKELLPIIAAAGGTALLIEYEDMFPYEGMLTNISSKMAYSRRQILEFLLLCQYYGFEVIPLVQTFGHMEYVLKLAEFQHLRENPSSPREICPSNTRSLVLIQEMLMQVLTVHQNAKRVHIGCDEVFTLNVCSQCLQRQIGTREIFVGHVKTVSKMIKTRFPLVTPLIWDDMLRSWPASSIATSNLRDYVEPVIWIYGDKITRLVPLSYWHWYFRHFRSIWVAGAFKGASDEMGLVPNTSLHVANQKAWLKFIGSYGTANTNVVGYVLTGWSRYDHYASLCELLPAAIPSLVVNLLLVKGAFSRQPVAPLASAYNEILRCGPTSTNTNTNTWHDLLQLEHVPTCSYPGVEFMPLLRTLAAFQQRAGLLFEKLYEKNSWMTIFQVRSGRTNRTKIKAMFEQYRFHQFSRNFTQLRRELRASMRRYYERAVVEEWFEEHVALHLHKTRFLQEMYDNFTAAASGRRRRS